MGLTHILFAPRNSDISSRQNNTDPWGWVSCCHSLAGSFPLPCAHKYSAAGGLSHALAGTNTVVWLWPTNTDGSMEAWRPSRSQVAPELEYNTCERSSLFSSSFRSNDFSFKHHRLGITGAIALYSAHTFAPTDLTLDLDPGPWTCQCQFAGDARVLQVKRSQACSLRVPYLGLAGTLPGGEQHCCHVGHCCHLV